MIPHIIHYCWFGGKPLPREYARYIASWRKYFPGWEIKKWDESNFDVDAIPYISEAYKAGKYAFVSDYARFKIIYEQGGVYFDTDVESIKDMTDIIEDGAFMGCETGCPGINVNPGLGIGAEDRHPFYKKMLDIYSALNFTPEENIVILTTAQLRRYGLADVENIQDCAGIKIYPKDYFCPFDFNTRKLCITENTRTIHHYSASWLPIRTKMINFVGRLFGKEFVQIFVRVKKQLINIGR